MSTDTLAPATLTVQGRIYEYVIESEPDELSHEDKEVLNRVMVSRRPWGKGTQVTMSGTPADISHVKNVFVTGRPRVPAALRRLLDASLDLGSRKTTKAPSARGPMIRELIVDEAERSVTVPIGDTVLRVIYR